MFTFTFTCILHQEDGEVKTWPQGRGPTFLLVSVGEGGGGYIESGNHFPFKELEGAIRYLGVALYFLIQPYTFFKSYRLGQCKFHYGCFPVSPLFDVKSLILIYDFHMILNFFVLTRGTFSLGGHHVVDLVCNFTGPCISGLWTPWISLYTPSKFPQKRFLKVLYSQHF